MFKKLLLTCGLIGFAASGALAQPMHGPGERGPRRAGPPAPMQLFEMADVDADGQVTAAEAKTARGLLFDRLDRNADGFLEGPEQRFARFSRHTGKMKRRMGRRVDRQMAIDTNNDGNISWAEFASRPSPTLERLDTNSDGMISKDEIQAHRKDEFSRRDANGDGVLNAADHEARRTARHEHHEQKRASLDSNQDGRVSRSEFISNEDRFMRHFDLNQDGIVTKAEIESAPKPRFLSHQ